MQLLLPKHIIAQYSERLVAQCLQAGLAFTLSEVRVHAIKHPSVLGPSHMNFQDQGLECEIAFTSNSVESYL